MLRVRECWQVHQHECELEWSPRPVRLSKNRLLGIGEGEIGSTVPLESDQRVDALLPHRVIGKRERLGDDAASANQVDPGAQPLGNPSGGVERLLRCRSLADRQAWDSRLLAPNGMEGQGSSTFRITTVIKSDPWLGDKTSIEIPRYVPVTDPKDPGGASLGHYGPVPEGLVAIIIGLGGLVIATLWIGTRISS